MIYNKEVQTTAVEPEAPLLSEEDIRQQILRERERELEADRVAREKELEEESVQLEKEIEQEIRGWGGQFRVVRSYSFDLDASHQT